MWHSAICFVPNVLYWQKLCLISWLQALRADPLRPFKEMQFAALHVSTWLCCWVKFYFISDKLFEKSFITQHEANTNSVNKTSEHVSESDPLPCEGSITQTHNSWVFSFFFASFKCFRLRFIHHEYQQIPLQWMKTACFRWAHLHEQRIEKKNTVVLQSIWKQSVAV